MVTDPVEASNAKPIFGHAHMDFRQSESVVLRNLQFSRLNPFNQFRLTAYMLAVLRLKFEITLSPPRTRYPAAG